MMGQHPSDRALVIIPTYNEIENLPLIVARVHKARPDVQSWSSTTGSPDGTGSSLTSLTLGDPDRVRHAPRRQGRPQVPPTWPGFAVGPGPAVLGAGGDGRRRQPCA